MTLPRERRGFQLLFVWEKKLLLVLQMVEFNYCRWKLIVFIFLSCHFLFWVSIFGFKNGLDLGRQIWLPLNKQMVHPIIEVQTLILTRRRGKLGDLCRQVRVLFIFGYVLHVQDLYELRERPIPLFDLVSLAFLCYFLFQENRDKKI